MSEFIFPDDFPSEEKMLDILKKTTEKSWRVDLGIDEIEAWLSNFSGKVFESSIERKLALWLLCNFTYYNEDEVNHLCGLLYKKLVHQLLIDKCLKTAADAECCIQNTIFTSIGKASESGGLLLYHFRQEAHLDLERFIFPTGIVDTEYDTIVCIDDVMISGGTASRFFYSYQDKLSEKKVYYITLITTDVAIKKLSEFGITVIYSIKLDDRNRAFSDSSLLFFKFPALLPYAQTLAEEYGKLIEPKKFLGHGNGQYCFGLYYNIPNNSLPIFWSSNEWIPIFQRKEKYQNAKQAKRKYSHFI